MQMTNVRTAAGIVSLTVASVLVAPGVAQAQWPITNPDGTGSAATGSAETIFTGSADLSRAVGNAFAWLFGFPPA